MTNQMYVPNNLRASRNDIDDEIRNLGENLGTYDLLVKIDYHYHHQDNDYDGGLSMLDRIKRKLGRFHPEWDIESMKNDIRNASDPIAEYAWVINLMFASESDIAYYGL